MEFFICLPGRCGLGPALGKWEPRREKSFLELQKNGLGALESGRATFQVGPRYLPTLQTRSLALLREGPPVCGGGQGQPQGPEGCRPAHAEH